MGEQPIGLVGLGQMGLPMARRWLDAGYAVRGYDLADTARQHLSEAGGTAAASPAEAAAGASVTVLMLPDSGVVDRVLDQLIEAGALSTGTSIVDMSSSEPASSRRNADRLAELGVTFVDAPVSGGVRGAVAGTLTVMVGADDAADLERVRPLLETVGTATAVGPVGAGHAVKALNNLLSAGHLWLTSEAVLVAEAFGVEPKTFLDVVNGSSGRSGSSEVKWPKFVLPGTYDSGFAAALMLKDARIATRLAASAGRETPGADAIVAQWAAAVADLPPGADHTEIARWLREH